MSKGGGSGGGTNTVTQSSDPWGAAQPYLKDIMGKAQDWYNSSSGSQYFPGSTTVPLSADTQQALGSIRSRATLGSPLMGAAEQQAQDTIQGKYLSPDSNPFLKDTFNQASGAVNSAVNGQFSAAGRYGSGAHAGVLADKNNQLATDIYGGNYNNERTRQATMSALAPTLASQDYTDANALLQSGNIQQQQSANDLQDQINRFSFDQNQPLNRINSYSSLLNGYGGLGGSSTSNTNTPTYTNTGSGILGGGLSGALGGAGLFNAFPATLGALGLSAGTSGAVGGGLGALLGLLSDRRLKENIKRVGTLISGIPVYAFNYIGNMTRQIGVMAQDVLRIKPEAVSRHGSGYYMVNYVMVGD